MSTFPKGIIVMRNVNSLLGDLKSGHRVHFLRRESLQHGILNYIYQPLRSAGYDTRSIFKRSLAGLNSEFSFSKAEEPSLPYYLPIAGGRIIGFILFPRVLVLCEMQSVSSRIWTRVAVSISYDDNHYTTGTSLTSLHLALFNPVWYSDFVHNNRRGLTFSLTFSVRTYLRIESVN